MAKGKPKNDALFRLVGSKHSYGICCRCKHEAEYGDYETARALMRAHSGECRKGE